LIFGGAYKLKFPAKDKMLDTFSSTQINWFDDDEEWTLRASCSFHGENYEDIVGIHALASPVSPTTPRLKNESEHSMKVPP